MVDVKCLSDYELQNKLNKLGYSPGPILPSTRKAYEKKLVQLLVSPPSVSPVMNGPRELDRAQDDDAKELKTTIILKGNILLSSEKHKGPKKRPEAFTTRPKALDGCCLAYKHSEGIRLTRRASGTRFKEWRSPRETHYCTVDNIIEFWNVEMFPVALRLAVFGIFIIVLFVYITVERKPFFG
ncbi:LEM domain-containing protein 1 isoform X2 [Acinonyx jubatus]|uniref:LEM domain-containing protein 1 isoform X2 n=1 Tax=Acinonyx jubatus TaxID=32536 RepID=A0A6I9ZMW6_ACIJB|nr:LEM domain-containing protein 1 isoform X2 [Acinonyx jubatus]